jgi:hypothetical protein
VNSVLLTKAVGFLNTPFPPTPISLEIMEKGNVKEGKRIEKLKGNSKLGEI